MFKLTIETLEQGVKMFKVNNKDTKDTSSSVYRIILFWCNHIITVNFEQTHHTHFVFVQVTLNVSCFAYSYTGFHQNFLRKKNWVTVFYRFSLSYHKKCYEVVLDETNTFICSKSTTETPEQCMKSTKVNNKDFRMTSITYKTSMSKIYNPLHTKRKFGKHN